MFWLAPGDRSSALPSADAHDPSGPSRPQPRMWRRLWRTAHSWALTCGLSASVLAPALAYADRAPAGARGGRAAKVGRAGASLRGSKAAVDHAYRRARTDGVPFARSRREVVRGAREGEYVRLPRAAGAYRLRGVALPYVLPATRDFVAAFARDYRRACGEPLTVTSAMRPTSVHLANSVEKTVHPTGMAVDLRVPRRGGCRAWMRASLLGLERRGVVNATEERRPAHFHVVVYRAP